MSHPRPNLSAAIYGRLTGDTGSGGLFNVSVPMVNQLRQTFASPGEAPPYLVMSYQYTENADAFNRRGYKIDLKIDAFVAEEDGTETRVGLTHLDAVNERIIGNWVPPATAPTYGLHGWFPSALSSGWSPTMFHHTGSTDMNEPGMLHTEHIFLLWAWA